MPGCVAFLPCLAGVVDSLLRHAADWYGRRRRTAACHGGTAVEPETPNPAATRPVDRRRSVGATDRVPATSRHRAEPGHACPPAAPVACLRGPAGGGTRADRWRAGPGTRLAIHRAVDAPRR